MTSVGVAVRAGAPAQALRVLWRFARPHTMIGTTLGVVGLWLLVADALPQVALGEGVVDLGLTLVAAWCVNVAIVGLNQIEDVDIDRVNKPGLPIAAGDLSPRAAAWIVGVATVVPVALAITQGPVELVAVAVALLVGAAYSLPPLRLKQRPVLAALAIGGVRSVVVNVGVAVHFAESLGGVRTIVEPAWALTLFVVPFALAIAVLKDVPDIEGDRRHAIATFSVRLGPRRVLGIGVALLTLAYVGMAVLGPLLCDGAQPVVLATTHLAALGLLISWATRVDPADRAQITRFYLRVWGLFFLEYLIVPLAWLSG